MLRDDSLRDNKVSQCARHDLLGSGTGDRSYLLVGTGASHVNYRHGADRCSVAGTVGLRWGPDP